MLAKVAVVDLDFLLVSYIAAYPAPSYKYLLGDHWVQVFQAIYLLKNFVVKNAYLYLVPLNCLTASAKMPAWTVACISFFEQSQMHE